VKSGFFIATVIAMDGVYAGIAGAYSCEINKLHHFYTLKLRIQVDKQQTFIWR